MAEYQVNLNSLKYFSGMITIGFFIPVVLSRIFSGYKNIKNGLNTINFAIVTTLSLSTFFISSLSSIDFINFNANGLLYLGFIIGLFSPFLSVNHRYMTNAEYRKQKFNKFNYKFIIYIILLLSVIGLNLAHSENYLNIIFYLIFIVIIGFIAMIIQSNKKYVGSHTGIVTDDLDETVYQDVDDPIITKDNKYSCVRVNKNDYFFRIDYGIVAWLTSLLFIFKSNNMMMRYIMTLLQGYFIGIYVAWFSYFRS